MHPQCSIYEYKSSINKILNCKSLTIFFLATPMLGLQYIYAYSVAIFYYKILAILFL